jgi:hypothetical protein
MKLSSGTESAEEKKNNGAAFCRGQILPIVEVVDDDPPEPGTYKLTARNTWKGFARFLKRDYEIVANKSVDK